MIGEAAWRAYTAGDRGVGPGLTFERGWKRRVTEQYGTGRAAEQATQAPAQSERPSLVRRVLAKTPLRLGR